MQRPTVPHVILMGDHGGGQPQVYEEVAKKPTARSAEELVCSTVTRSTGPPMMRSIST